jgi:septum formation protein
MVTDIDFYLASQSPRRRELLKQIRFSFAVLAVEVDEAIIVNETAENYVLRLAEEKAKMGWFSSERHNGKAVLGSDTAVVINGDILGKPDNREHAISMLTSLSGKTHQVMTAVALAKQGEYASKPELSTVISVSDVTFKDLSKLEIEQYWQTGECDDKAGAYAIQGIAAAFVRHLSGSYSGVMGLPLHETVELLHQAGISTDFVVVS